MIRRATAVAALAITFAAHASGQAPTMADAQRALQQQRPADALGIAQQLTAADSTNAPAWNITGIALRRLSRWKEAVAAHHRAIRAAPNLPGPYAQLGITFAAAAQPDSAFAWLARARDTRRIDIQAVLLDPAAAPLLTDARVASLLPAASEYTQPFVEGGVILQEWRGEAANDQFGWIARNIGDVDGDRIADVVTSAPTHGGGAAAAGKVYVYSGRTGAPIWSARGQGAGWRLGFAIDAAGDVNGDGVPDVVAGAPGADRALVYSGRDGAVLLTLRGDSASQFGQQVADVGDVNADGRADVIVGAPQHAGGAGRARVFSGADGAVLLTLDGERQGDTFGTALAGGSGLIVVGAGGAGTARRGRGYVFRGLSTSPFFHIEGDSTSAGLGGMFASIIGDVDNDGSDDVYLSDFSNGAGGPGTGRVFLHSGRDGSLIRAPSGQFTSEGFGIGPADAGDVDRDGHDDLIVGAWQHASAAPAGGRVYLLSGRSGSVMRTWTNRVAGETLGFDATGIGDVNGDGHIDFLVTSAWSAVNGIRSGRAFIVSGAPPQPR